MQRNTWREDFIQGNAQIHVYALRSPSIVTPYFQVHVATVHGGKPQLHCRQLWYDDDVNCVSALSMHLQEGHNRHKQRKCRRFYWERQQQLCTQACSNAAAFWPWRKYKKK